MPLKLSTDKFIEKAKLVHGSKFCYEKVVYERWNKRVTIICPNQHVFEQTPNDHLTGYGCPVCAGNKRKTTEEFISEAKLIHGDIYDYSLTEYIKNDHKVKIICRIHGIFDQQPNNHLHGKQGCPICGNIKVGLANRRTTEEFIRRSTKLHKGRYDYSKTSYVKNSQLVNIICPSHGLFSQKPVDHLSGKGCSNCVTKSKGEDTIYEYLVRNAIEFKRQVKLFGCKRKKLLPFDFGIYKNNILLGLIEFNGKQHYGIGGWTNNLIRLEKELRETQERDVIKKNFCDTNNIPFVAISYSDMKNINSILETFIKNLQGF